MRNAPPGGIPDVGGLIGRTGEAASRRLGTPVVDRVVGEDRWMVYEGDGWSLRVRLAPGDGIDRALVRSWTASFRPPLESLAAACSALGLEPAPPTPADRASEPALIRRLLPDPASGAHHSLTAVARPDGVRAVTVFDEAPDWRHGARPEPS